MIVIFFKAFRFYNEFISPFFSSLIHSLLSIVILLNENVSCSLLRSMSSYFFFLFVAPIQCRTQWELCHSRRRKERKKYLTERTSQKWYNDILSWNLTWLSPIFPIQFPHFTFLVSTSILLSVCALSVAARDRKWVTMNKRNNFMTHKIQNAKMAPKSVWF